jgi:spermidine synthase
VSPAVAAILLIGSGAAALVYQTLWVKQLALVVGVDVYAVTTGVSAFFAGLALGSAVLGRVADRSARPARLYAAIEIGVAILGALGTLALAGLPPLYVRAWDAVGPLAWALPFLVIGAPAFLMGGTLPALLRAVSPRQGDVAGAGGRFYAANTAGAVLGALATPFVLIPLLGVRGTGLAAATLNLALAGAAAIAPSHILDPARARSARTQGSGVALTLYAVAGGIALGYEVVWSQAIVQFLNTRAYAFALVLATYLTGLVLGSALYARIADRAERPWLVFGVLEAGAGLAALATFAALGAWLPSLQQALSAMVRDATGSFALGTYASMVLAPTVIVLLPTILLGAAFPAVVRLACGADHVARDVGTVTALNTAGGIAGTCLTGFVAIPLLGLRGTLVVLTTAAVVVAGVAVVRGSRRPARAAILVGILTIAVAAGGFQIPRDHLARLLVASRGGTLAAYEESPGGTVAVVTEPYFDASFNRLYIHGVSNSGDNLMSLRYMRLQALIPLILHKGRSESALVVGMGTGITCGTLLTYPSLEQRVCAELLPAVVRLVDRFRGNYDVGTDPGIDIRISDGRHLLLRDPTRYDLITLEPPPPIAAGIVNLYSRDFYELCRDRLNPNGLMAQWIPLMTQSDADMRSLVRSFIDVFPYAALFTTELHEVMLVGSPDPLIFSGPMIMARFAQEGVRDALVEAGIRSPAALLATYVTDRDGLAAYAGDAPPVTDDQPRIEYADFTRPGEFAVVLRNLLEQQRDPPLDNERLLPVVAAERQLLHTFYQAAIYHYSGQSEQVGPLMQHVLQADPENTYYRWFVGGGS